MTYRIGELIADSLIHHGVDRAFSVPGESFLGLLDALLDRPALDLVTCRHEGSASLAAVADAKLTGRPGVVMASRGPGAFNAAIGVHVAAEEAIPLILLIGQVDRPNLGRGAVQEIDSAKAFAGLLKWSGRIDHPAQAAEIMARAFAIASTGTPGPVAVELPEDVLVETIDKPAPRRHGMAKATASPNEIEQVLETLRSSRKPVMIVGGECRSDTFRTDLLQLAEQWGVPVALTNKNQDQFPNTHPLFVGQLSFFASPAHVDLFAEADLFIALGSRMGDVSSLGYGYPRQAHARQKFVHIYPDAGVIGRNFQTDLSVVSSSHPFVTEALRHAGRHEVGADWLAKVGHAAVKAHGWNPDRIAPEDVMGQAITAIAARAAPDAVLTTDSGNFAGWVHRIFKMTPQNRLLGSACGAMGSGVPAAVAAGLRYPDRQVIAFCGDGGFLMNGNEIATAVARNLNIKIVVSNNGSYGTIRTHQQRHFPGRVSGTDLSNPNFAVLARAFGATGFRIEHTGQVRDVVAEAMAVRGPAMIEICNDVDVNVDRSLQLSTN